MEGDIHGVRIIPPLVEFKDAVVNVTHKINITVKNISKTSKEVRYWHPQLKNFKLKVKNPELPIAPGLEVPAVIEYTTSEAIERKDRVVVTVDGEVVEVPIRAYPPQPKLVLKGPVSFGNVVANSKVIGKEIMLHNHGSKEGEFKIKYTGSKEISIIPSSGTIAANSAQAIRVEYVTKKAGSFQEEAKVHLEGHDVSTLQISGHVVQSRLELLNVHDQLPTECVKFGSAPYETDKTESAVLYNNGPEPVCFVAVLNEGAVGQQMDKDLLETHGGEMNPVTSLVTALPNQGMLAPYEKIPIFFRFSPRWIASKKGFNCQKEPPPRQDFALFMQIKAVGASEGYSNTNDSEKINVEGSVLEIPLTATALPVLMSVSPQMKYNFGECPVGEHVDQLCTLRNDCNNMPITFEFRRVAHFTAHPPNGKIKAGQTQDIIFSFSPHQVGTFKPVQYIEILGQVADKENPFVMHLKVIHTIPLNFLGVAPSVTINKEAVFNPGITPKITNEVGMYIESTTKSAGKSPRAALLNSRGTKLHHLRTSSENNQKGDALVAFPNDRAGSIRPSNRQESYQTIFTRRERHTYVDPDYAYEDEEAIAVKRHRQYYIDFIRQLKEKRRIEKQNDEHNQFDDQTDIAIKPAAGLRPPKLTQDEVKPDPRPPTPPNAGFKLLSSADMTVKEISSAKKERDGLNAVPITPEEKRDCSKVLSPQELYQVIIGPPTIDFGEVCLKSVSTKLLNIVNNLDQYIHVNVHVDCRELRQTSPLSQVVPPLSKAVLPLIFESNTKGKFQRSLDYTINNCYKSHVTTFAEVVSVALQLDKEELILQPQFGMPTDAGIRGVINLQNKLNHTAQFTWTPILGQRGTAFSIRPATGTVEPFSDLDCEVVFHPSYLAPEEGEFNLQVHGGNTLNLNCKAELGESHVQFIDRRIMFGQVPLHLTTTRTAMLKNTGPHHAFFQILDPNPFAGLTVSPTHGVVPVGGTAEIKIHLTPNAVIKFDTRVNVNIRGSKTLELRMGGTVEPPIVDIDIPTFNLGGVYCGSSLTKPFQLINKANTKARVEFDLSRYSDFSLSFPHHHTAEDYTFQLMNPGLFTIALDADETIDCLIHFKPTEVASYDFVMPVSINQTRAPSPSATPFPATPAPSNKNSLQHIINPRPVHVTIATPRRKVVATGLRMPLQLSHNVLEFMLSPGFYEMSSASGIGQSKGTLFVNNSDRTLKWELDLSQVNEVVEEGIFKFLHPSGMPFLTQGDKGVEGTLEAGQTQSLGVIFCPNKPGHYEASIPIVLDDDFEHPYQYLKIEGELKTARVWFDPLAIVLTPVPLETEIGTEFQILAANYTKNAVLNVEKFEIENEDGTKFCPVDVTFIDTQDIKPCCGDEGQQEPYIIQCKVTFKSNYPVSFNHSLKFFDDFGNNFYLPLTATADNCLMTCYPFLAQHRSDHQIVCEQGHTLKGRKTLSRESMNAGEAVLVPCDEPPRSQTRASTTETVSNFEISSSSYESTSQSVTESTFPSTPRDGALNKFVTDSVMESRGRNDLASRSLGSALFPEEDTEEGIFHTEVLLAVQRWFSSQGWNGGPNPVLIPESFRSGLTKKPTEEKARTSKGTAIEANNLKKEFKTVYDMINHLCGRHIPGIPINNPLPKNPFERAKQVYWQHQTLLTFMKIQGACVASVKPEYLMEPKDYKTWVQLQKDLDAQKHQGGHRETKPKTEEEEAIEDQLFEAVSKRAWTDVLLQLLKTLVLSKITPKQFKSKPSPFDNHIPMADPDPRCSNVYCVGERILLLWLNHSYEHLRHVIWKNCKKGGIPPSRWVVNFDFDLLDGLVLASVLTAYVPFLASHLEDMYTQPSTAEQCLHNALKVVNALQYIGIDYDIQAIDVTDPNPISLMLLVVHLYSELPHYLPKANVKFISGLHDQITRQIRLSNPSSKPVTYQALIAGHDAKDFTLPKGNVISVPPKSINNVSVQFTSRYLRPAEASIVFVGRRQGSGVGSTMMFTLTTLIDNITPKDTVICESQCYELKSVPIEVTNPFPEAGNFRIVVVEMKDDLADKNQLVKPSKKKPKKARSRVSTDHRKSRSEFASDRDLSTQASSVRILKDDGIMHGGFSAFHCRANTIYLEAAETSTVDINFLPFQTGKRQCSLIFVNENIGEFVYAVEGHATLPKPFAVSPKATQNLRITSAVATSHGSDENVVHWKCEVGQTLEEKLTVPVINKAQERALMIAAKNHLSELELDRRQKTGTLTVETLTRMAVNVLSSNPQAWSKNLDEESSFRIEVDSRYYRVPAAITIPNIPMKTQSGGKGSNKEDYIDIPISFRAREPGKYPCQLILRSQDDVRIFKIECIVSPEGSQAEIEFSSHVHEPVTQDIPIINETNHDWQMEAEIEGPGFVGPDKIVAKAYQITMYPLLFRPQFEGDVRGKLILKNLVDNIDHTFNLVGQGKRPLPLDTISVTCKVKQSVTQVLKVPNLTRKKLFYQVETDINFMKGGDSLTVLPGQTGYYEVTFTPTKRGIQKGAIVFIATENPVKEVDSEGEEMVEKDDLLNDNYRVWYSVDFTVQPDAPEATLDITCACQQKAMLEVGVTNPTTQTITLEAEIKGVGISGPDSITLAPKARGVYEVIYFPAVLGNYRGSLVFYNEVVGEFWYDLKLTATKPVPTTLDHMECELGRWVRQNITLSNPTDETLELIPMLSNINNFKLDRDNDQALELRPHHSMKVPLTFLPSTLGEGDHFCKISFMCKQLGELEYLVSGSGTLPQPQEPVSVTTLAGSSTTLIVPFRNPLDIAVFADIYLIDKQAQTRKVLEEDVTILQESPFCLLLKQNKGLRLGPKSNIDIPVSFAPETMNMAEAVLSIVITKEDKTSWAYVCTDKNGIPLSKTNSGGLREIKWHYPIQGYPELVTTKEISPALIKCKARNRTEERLEVTLSGVAPSNGGPKRGIKVRAVTPKNAKPKAPEGIVVGDTINMADEFTYEVLYNNSDAKKDLDSFVGLSLVRSYRDKTNGLVVLVFNIVYSPARQMKHDAELVVKGSTGGLWRFPLCFIATQPNPDDTVTIEAIGLNKEAAIGFKMYTPNNHPVPYNAYFVAGSDQAFQVSPASGELLPEGTKGTLIRVSFIPQKYGKIYHGHLVIHSGDNQWTYNVRGTIPDYQPPRGFSAKPMAGPHPEPFYKLESKNFIKDNLRLTTTAVSSPIKGAPILRKKQDIAMF